MFDLEPYLFDEEPSQIESTQDTDHSFKVENFKHKLSLLEQWFGEYFPKLLKETELSFKQFYNGGLEGADLKLDSPSILQKDSTSILQKDSEISKTEHRDKHSRSIIPEGSLRDRLVKAWDTGLRSMHLEKEIPNIRPKDSDIIPEGDLKDKLINPEKPIAIETAEQKKPAWSNFILNT